VKQPKYPKYNKIVTKTRKVIYDLTPGTEVEYKAPMGAREAYKIVGEPHFKRWWMVSAKRSINGHIEDIMIDYIYVCS